MSFAADVKRFVIKVRSRTPAMMIAVATKAHRSIKEGDPTIGSPGQPVQTGNLRNSWILNVQPTHADITTTVAYARAIEDGVGRFGPLTLRSTVGGFHSVKATIAGASSLQSQALREMGP